jgi:D-amino peptidase
MKLRTLPLMMITGLLFAPSYLAQRRTLKVMLLYDMEGISRATDFKHTSFAHPSEYAEGRKSLTDDVNAAIAGLKSAGATEIVVVDGHGSGNNTGPDVLEDQLLAPAKMQYRDAPFDIYMDSYDHSFDAIVAIGMHAGAGNRVGFLSHTYTFEDVEYQVNGMPFNESMILAAGAARLKIPLIMVSGDDQLEKEIRREMPWVKYATVKRAVDRAKAEAFPRDEVARRIETAAREALQNLASAKLPDWHGPYRFALAFQDEGQARLASMIPGAELFGNGLRVQVRANDFEDGYRLSIRLIGLAGISGRSDARQAVLAAQANAGQLQVNTVDWLYDRFLERLPAPAVSSPPTSQRQRYWGAR